MGSYFPVRSLRPKWWYDEHFAHWWARVFNENMLDNNAIWPWSSGIAAGTAHKQLRLQQHTPILQVSHITQYVFWIHWYVDFADMDTCSIHYDILVIKYRMTTFSCSIAIYIYLDNTYKTCWIICCKTHDIKVHSWLCITTTWLYSL